MLHLILFQSSQIENVKEAFDGSKLVKSDSEELLQFQ